LLGARELDELRALAAQLSGRTVQMVNSTAMGGGVAEILNRLIPLIQELDFGRVGTSSPAARIFSKSRRRFIMLCTEGPTKQGKRISICFCDQRNEPAAASI